MTDDAWTWGETLFAGTAAHYTRGRLPYAPRAGGGAGWGAGARRAGTAARRGVWAGHAGAGSGAPVRRGRRSGPGRRDDRRGAPGGRRGAQGHLGAGPGRGTPVGPRHLHAGDLRPVLPLDGPRPGGGDRTTNAAARRRPGAHLGPEGRTAPHRGAAAPAGPVRRDRRTGPALPRPGPPRRAGAAAARHSGRRGRGPRPGGLRRSAADRRPGRPLERTADDAVAGVFALSSSTPHLFAGRRPAFESDLRRLLARTSPSGLFSERQPSSEVFIWRPAEGR